MEAAQTTVEIVKENVYPFLLLCLRGIRGIFFCEISKIFIRNFFSRPYFLNPNEGPAVDTRIDEIISIMLQDIYSMCQYMQAFYIWIRIGPILKSNLSM